MNSQIDEKLENLIKREVITDDDIETYLGYLPEGEELIVVLNNISKHIRTYGRNSPALTEYIQEYKSKNV